MNDGVKILLARLESKPEELGRWEHTFNNFKKYLTEEDRQLVWDKICAIKQQEFTDKVLGTLLADKEEEERKALKSIQKIAEASLDLAWKEAYTKCTLDTFNYVTKNRMVFEDKK
jgi:hypothetical protein